MNWISQAKYTKEGVGTSFVLSAFFYLSTCPPGRIFGVRVPQYSAILRRLALDSGLQPQKDESRTHRTFLAYIYICRYCCRSYRGSLTIFKVMLVKKVFEGQKFAAKILGRSNFFQYETPIHFLTFT